MNIRALVGGPKPTRFLPFCRYQNELSETQLLKLEESEPTLPNRRQLADTQSREICFAFILETE